MPTLRGGQTTFHGPGQLTAYLLLDLRAHALTPRCYVRMLESAVIKTLQTYGVSGRITENPGVWVGDGSDEKKICAVGVHMRRNITSYGVGLNVNTDLWWFDRIVACGLEGKKATSLLREGVEGETVEGVGRVLAGVLAERLRIDVKSEGEGEVQRMLEEAVKSESEARDTV